jgi:DNA-binding response OmpR family regulator
LQKKKILIIDDSLVVLAQAMDFLAEEGYEVCIAANAIDANHHIFASEKKPDLIIIDIMMPLLSGNKKAHLLKQSYQTQDIPILFISSKTEAELKQLASESQVNGYLCKPFRKFDLIEAVRNCI